MAALQAAHNAQAMMKRRTPAMVPRLLSLVVSTAWSKSYTRTTTCDLCGPMSGRYGNSRRTSASACSATLIASAASCGATDPPASYCAVFRADRIRSISWPSFE